LKENHTMTEFNVTDHMHALGAQAKTASALMAKASAAVKNKALRTLAALLRANIEALQIDNAKDIARALTAGLEAPMVDRLKLTPKVLETCAQGCEQLAAMPEVIGEITGLKEQPSGIRPLRLAHRREGAGPLPFIMRGSDLQSCRWGTTTRTRRGARRRESELLGTRQPPAPTAVTDSPYPGQQRAGARRAEAGPLIRL
jgi:hypothetical protein